MERADGAALALWGRAEASAARNDRPSGLIVTLLQTAHQNQSDFPLLLPTVLKFTSMAGVLPPTTALHLNNRAMLSFLHWHVPASMVRPGGRAPACRRQAGSWQPP